MNRLAAETSPYLRQHQDNPVDWYPWGDEAFDRARAENKAVLLSVGYSACHWCHVMAHESFEDEATAELMNRMFVNIKVDREERPDVDAVYMEAVQAMTGQGGWPMTVFLTPDGQPFFGGTYFPPERLHGRPSFTELLHAINEAWTMRREELTEQAERLTEAIGARLHIQRGDGHDAHEGEDALASAFQTTLAMHDPEWGGFGSAPKFPQTASLELLLRAHSHGKAGAMDAVITSLDAMASGGMYDHLGGGFARYSVDAFWMVPHFEKMLYDQAQLARIYVHAWQVTGEARFLQVAAETIEYVLRDLRSDEGGLFSAEDADSEGEEGRFYVWSQDEIAEILGTDAGAAIEWYGVTKSGNFEGRNILHRPTRGALERPPQIEDARERLFQARAKRVRPGLDDKVLTEWNAMFISTLAEAGAATQKADWVAAAVRTAELLLAELRRDDGRWLRSWQPGRGARHLAFAADYANLVDAFTRLGEATGQRRWIDEARRTADQMLELFWDDEDGGLFTTGSDAEQLIVRSKDVFDGAVASANSTAALSLLRLSALTGNDQYRSRASAILELGGDLLIHHPSAFAHALAAFDFAMSGATEIVVTGDRADLVAVAQRRYLPNAVIAWGEPFDSPLWEHREAGRAYVCHDYACLAPATSADDLEAQLG